MNDQVITDKQDRDVIVVDTVKGVCIDKQSPDIAGDVHVNRDDLDNSAGDQIIMSEYASDEIGDTVPLIHLMTQVDMLHAVQRYMAATLDPRQFEGMPQVCVKLENDTTGGVSESQKHF